MSSVKLYVPSVDFTGTRTLSFFDGDCSDGESMFLLAIKELPFTESHSDNEYGVCFVDTCVGTIHVIQRNSWRHYSIACFYNYFRLASLRTTVGALD